ncbi:endo-1,4-beta-xylanase [Pseudoroseomonas wenyumeiae]
MLAPGALALPAGALAQQAQPGLGELARANGVTFGAAMQGGLLRQDADYAVAFAREAAIVVPEYEGKWGTLQPQEGRFNSAALDTILAWGRRAGRPVRGHALIWHQDMPDWTKQALAEGPDRARAVMAAHIGTILEHTQPQIRDWDVVNEVVADPPGSDTPQASGELRDTPWLRALGPSYIETALKLAREADPTLRLTLNEYGIEEDTPPPPRSAAACWRWCGTWWAARCRWMPWACNRTCRSSSPSTRRCWPASSRNCSRSASRC